MKFEKTINERIFKVFSDGKKSYCWQVSNLRAIQEKQILILLWQPRLKCMVNETINEQIFQGVPTAKMIVRHVSNVRTPRETDFESVVVSTLARTLHVQNKMNL
jgi:hypothetical protein